MFVFCCSVFRAQTGVFKPSHSVGYSRHTLSVSLEESQLRDRHDKERPQQLSQERVQASTTELTDSASHSSLPDWVWKRSDFQSIYGESLPQQCEEILRKAPAERTNVELLKCMQWTRDCAWLHKQPEGITCFLSLFYLLSLLSIFPLSCVPFWFVFLSTLLLLLLLLLL
jgi:hypothetical protein